MDRTAIMLRVAALLIAVGLTLAVLEFWGMAAGIMGHYLSGTSPQPTASKDNGVVTVEVLPPPDKSSLKSPPSKSSPPKSPPPK